VPTVFGQRPHGQAGSSRRASTPSTYEAAKTTGDPILLTRQCVDALASRPPGLIDRGFHVLKGKSAAVQVFGLDQETDALVDLTT
jgi:adenylate cyclase